jgi:pilus assembly protein FimV
MDNALLLPGAGVLVALLAAFGLYRLSGRKRKPAGETSFLESRLQPDSFFGASGGQRIDTRETGAGATGNSSSSMSYSLSQLDAIGDVDPVAEADVYLAYGRDLQAEEILKEAMRATPERMAIRSKLLEVYAKRRDTKGFELLASQMFNLTRGQGEEWAQAQTLGFGIDPENPLYQPGGQPEEVRGASGQLIEPLGASTVPFTAPAGPPSFQPAADARLDNNIDLDLDLGLEPPSKGMGAHEATQAFTTGADMGPDTTIDFDDIATISTRPAGRPAPARAPAPVPPPAAEPDNGLDFDLGDLSIDSGPAVTSKASETTLNLHDTRSSAAPAVAQTTHTADGDPLARKLDLAEEFRQIGDLEGARDLLEEVVAKASGVLRSKAQTMLDGLG